MRANNIKIIVNQIIRINGNVKSVKQIIIIGFTNDEIIVSNMSIKINLKGSKKFYKILETRFQ